MVLGLKDKHVLVTGSSRGIGFAIAKGFLNEGAKVILTSNNTNELQQAKLELDEMFNSEKSISFACDFTKPDDIATLKNNIIATVGRLDVLVANVGSGKSLSDPIPEQDHFNTVFDLNFNTAVNTSREFYPLIKESNGSIVFIASIAGIESIGAPIDYAVAKSAVISFSKNLARKVARDGVRVNAIAPGNIYFKNSVWDEKMQREPERITSLIKSTVPMNRFGTPEEIADACLFLASERASFITGATLRVDGGQTVSLG